MVSSTFEIDRPIPTQLIDDLPEFIPPPSHIPHASTQRYIPVLMGQAKIYWDMEHYAMVERIFKRSAEFCSEHDAWKLNVAHVFFMQVRIASTLGNS